MVTKTQGTVLKWNAGIVGEVTNISGLSSPSTKIDITSFADTFKSYRPGRRKAGTFVFGVNYNPDNTVQAAMWADRTAGTEREVILVAPSGTTTTITFNALISDMPITTADDNIYKMNITMVITSKPIRSS